jgi:hypothetical protein
MCLDFAGEQEKKLRKILLLSSSCECFPQIIFLGKVILTLARLYVM